MNDDRRVSEVEVVLQRARDLVSAVEDASPEVRGWLQERVEFLVRTHRYDRRRLVTDDGLRARFRAALVELAPDAVEVVDEELAFTAGLCRCVEQLEARVAQAIRTGDLGPHAGRELSQTLRRIETDAVHLTRDETYSALCALEARLREETARPAFARAA